MATRYTRYDRKALHDAVMDAGYAFKLEDAAPKQDGSKPKLGEIIGASTNEDSFKIALTELATGVIGTAISPKDEQAKAILFSAQKNFNAYLFDYDSRAPGHRDGLSKATHQLTGIMRNTASEEIARQNEEHAKGASIA
jgi:hypothetical protein